MSIVMSFTGLCLLLLLGKFIRVKVRFLQRLYLPSAVIGGLLGLIVLQTLGHRLPEAWTAGWTIVFIVGTIYNLTYDVSDEAWLSFWRIYLLIHIALAVVAIIWFTIGGFIDLKAMLKKLKISTRDDKDDGFIIREE